MGARISDIFYMENEYTLFFYCPACKDHHPIRLDNEYMSGWHWDGSTSKPTVAPDVKVNEHIDRLCHFTITNGFIHYHRDSRHELAGQKMKMFSYDAMKNRN